jgi:diadenosine tetraphosphate (Ap4A) HIT family hydrolase
MQIDDVFELSTVLSKDCYFIGDLPLCSVLLMDDSQYPWLILVPRVAEVTEIMDLSDAQRQQLWLESHQISTAMTQVFAPDKLNIAAIGNMVPQLHLHHVARYRNDVSWPKPVWGQLAPIPYSNDKVTKLITTLQQQIFNKGD